MLNYLLSVRTYLTALVNRDDRGATAVEYALLVVLIALALVAGATVLGTSLSNLFSSIGSYLGGVTV